MIQPLSNPLSNVIPGTQPDQSNSSNEKSDNNQNSKASVESVLSNSNSDAVLPRSVNPKTIQMAFEANVKQSVRSAVTGNESERPQVGGKKPESPDHFTPEKTAERLKEFTGQVLENNSEKLPEDFEKVRKKLQEAVEKGLQQGENELGSNLNEPTERLISKIKSTIQRSLSSFLGNISSSNLQGVQVSLMRGQQQLNQALTQLMAQQNTQAAENSRIPSDIL